MKARKTYYYSDELNDDFAATKDINAKPVSADFPYIHKNPLWRAAAAILYRGIVTPLVFLYCKICFGLRIKGKKHLRGLRGGYFLYANHTQHAADAFIPSLVSFPRKAYIVTGRVRCPSRACAMSCRCSARSPCPTRRQDCGASPRCSERGSRRALRYASILKHTFGRITRTFARFARARLPILRIAVCPLYRML